MEALATELRQRHGITVTVIGADLETNDGATRLHADVKQRGIVLSALVNNAGYATFGEFKDANLATELAMMQLNMNTVVALTRLFLPDLLATRGKILNTASTAAFQPGPYMAVYYATKAFVLSFSEAIASELEGSGVTVTALCPGPTASGFQDKADMHDSALVKGKKLPSSEDSRCRRLPRHAARPARLHPGRHELDHGAEHPLHAAHAGHDAGQAAVEAGAAPRPEGMKAQPARGVDRDSPAIPGTG